MNNIFPNLVCAVHFEPSCQFVTSVFGITPLVKYMGTFNWYSKKPITRINHSHMYQVVTWVLGECMVTPNSRAVDCSNLVLHEIGMKGTSQHDFTERQDIWSGPVQEKSN